MTRQSVGLGLLKSIVNTLLLIFSINLYVLTDYLELPFDLSW